MHSTAAYKMCSFFPFFLSFFPVSGAILERSGVKSVLSRERDGAERCGEVLSAGAHIMDSSTSCK